MKYDHMPAFTGHMPTYIVRVELHKASESDYQKVHSYMEDAGFTSHFMSFGSGWLALPVAEYATTDKVEIKTVMDRAQTAANKTGILFSVMVVEVKDFLTAGLSIYTPRPV